MLCSIKMASDKSLSKLYKVCRSEFNILMSDLGLNQWLLVYSL